MTGVTVGADDSRHTACTASWVVPSPCVAEPVLQQLSFRQSAADPT